MNKILRNVERRLNKLTGIKKGKNMKNKEMNIIRGWKRLKL